jgi:hypothetical protein
MPISTIGANGLNKTEDFTIDGLTVGKGGGNVSNNTVVGLNAGVANTTGKITAVGYLAARFNTTGSGNTAIGGNDGAQDGALYLNTTGNYNIAMGTGAVASNTTGSNNTGIGYSALQNNTTASNNTAVGYQALYSNTTGIQNTAVGTQAGYSITTSNYGCFVGDGAGTSTTGARNTFIGQGAGNAVTSGANNTIIGGYNGNNGGLDIRTASNYIVLADGNGNPRGWWDNNGLFNLPKRIYFTETPPGVTLDSSGQSVTLTNGSNITFSSFSGVIIVTDTTASGSTGILICGGGQTAIGGQIGSQYSTSSGSGNIRWFNSAGAYVLQNNTGGTVTLNVMTFRTRTGS